MRVVIFALVVMMAAILVGCGGGATATSTTITELSSDMVGTWRVPGIGLPDDELGVQTDGDVVVNSEVASSRSGSQVKIGTCDSQGTLNLNGSWRCGGVDYSINASGSMQLPSHSMTLRATIVAGADRHEGQVLSGDRVSGDQLPLPQPTDSDNGGVEQPPPVPGDDPGTGSGGDSDIELPPPPPDF